MKCKCTEPFNSWEDDPNEINRPIGKNTNTKNVLKKNILEHSLNIS
jgi:hypothetical protein